MADSGRNHHADAGMHGDDFVVEFHFGVGAAFQKVIGFRQSLMVMLFRAGADFCDMQAAGKRVDSMERSTSCPARTGDSGNL